MNARRLGLGCLGLFLALLGSVLGLETLSRTLTCPEPNYATATVCREGPLPPQDARLWEEALALRRAGRPIPAEMLENLVIPAPRDALANANGLACRGRAWVSDDLPSAAFRFVARHELEHRFQAALDLHPRNPEFAANLVAFREHPWGGIVTMGFSLVRAWNLLPRASLPCHLVRWWRIFKIYFLPFAPSSP